MQRMYACRSAPKLRSREASARKQVKPEAPTPDAFGIARAKPKYGTLQGFRRGPVVPTTRNLKRTTFCASRFRFFLFCRLLATIPFKAQSSRSFIQAPATVPKCVFAYVIWLKKSLICDIILKTTREVLR